MFRCSHARKARDGAENPALAPSPLCSWRKENLGDVCTQLRFEARGSWGVLYSVCRACGNRESRTASIHTYAGGTFAYNTVPLRRVQRRPTGAQFKREEFNLNRSHRTFSGCCKPRRTLPNSRLRRILELWRCAQGACTEGLICTAADEKHLEGHRKVSMPQWCWSVFFFHGTRP